MTCDCSCYDEYKCVILHLPDKIDPDKEVRSVTVDRCIAGVIAWLWCHGIRTLGCCCGHNQERPSVVISNDTNPQEVLSLINRIEDRAWRVCKWELAEYNSEESEVKSCPE
jgi:hypothetical protein